ncbi:MAG: hypothetical protein L0Z53_23285 [Acidobacteriales bacterium]|nr:hypothetical protein [Terriglobales bacterium]
MHKRQILTSLMLLAMATVLAMPTFAHAPSGAIFTTVADGSEVNQNIYEAKTDVYLDGGPGEGAPQHAAGLDDGTYVFQVTDPSGKDLLSTDPAACRRFTVSAGIITAVVPAGGCEHVTGLDVDHGATTVQLMPYLDTTNNGGVYKAWVVTVEDFLAGCVALGVPNGLAVVDCGLAAGNKHGFIPSHSKTDNFKVRSPQSAEIDIQFFDRDGNQLDGQGITWTDTLGGSNKKWSHLMYWNEVHVAHVEAVEDGTHQIDIQNQPGCTVGRIKQNGKFLRTTGPQNIFVRINNGTKNSGISYYTVNFVVFCE